MINTFESEKRKRSRLIVRNGNENYALLTADIAYIFTLNKVAFAVDKNARKYICDKNLAELEEELDPLEFFRANRQFIINIDYIKGFHVFEKVKLQVDLMIPHPQHPIIISQENAPHFKKWISET